MLQMPSRLMTVFVNFSEALMPLPYSDKLQRVALFTLIHFNLATYLLQKSLSQHTNSRADAVLPQPVWSN